MSADEKELARLRGFADEKGLARLRELAIPWNEGYALAMAGAMDTVVEMRKVFNEFAPSDPYETGKTEPWDLSVGDTEPVVTYMTGVFTRILNQKGLLKIDPA